MCQWPRARIGESQYNASVRSDLPREYFLLGFVLFTSWADPKTLAIRKLLVRYQESFDRLHFE